jgi:hypothetical protein
MEKLKINYKTPKKTWMNLQIKTIKRAMNSTDQTTDTTQKSRTCALRSLTPLTLSVEKIVNLYGFIISL